MVMIIGTIAWAFAAFVILHDNAKTRRDLKAYQGQFNGNMKSFWARLFDSEKSAKIEIERVNALVKDLSDLARRTGTEDAKLEQKAFFEISELRDALAQNVDNMADRNAAIETILNRNGKSLTMLTANVQDLMQMELERRAKKKLKKTVIRKTTSTKGSRARA
jgi:signal transduction histidine kinase